MSTAVSVPRLLTIEQFLKRPPRTDGQREELIEGEVCVSPNVKRGHTEIVRRLGIAFRPLENLGYVILTDFACAFMPKRRGQSLPNPDLGVALATEWNAVPNNAWLDRSPALVVEVNSPGNRQLQRKAAIYLDHGAVQVWLVYPQSHRVRVITQDGEDFEVRRGETLEFRGLHIDVNAIL